MDKDDLRERTRQLALRIMRLCCALPRRPEAQVIRDQVLRYGTSLAANYRAACRSRSRSEFRSRLATVLEETDETLFWLELLVDSGLVRRERLRDLIGETEQLMRIFGAAERTVRSQIRNPKSEIPNL